MPAPVVSRSWNRYYPQMSVEIIRRGAAGKVPARPLKIIAQAILELVDRTEADLTVVLLGDREMQQLNAKYRKKNYATDVLAFPVQGTLPVPYLPLGDVVISIEKARQQAHERNRPTEAEVITLLIHGIVHLLGYDHERSAADARVMQRLESKIYRALCERRLIEV